MKPSLILFDLDGTLLPMDQDAFIEKYFAALAARICPYGYEPKALIKALWKGVAAMTANDGTMTNEARFWEVFCSLLGDGIMKCHSVFEDFYRTEFHTAKASTSPAPLCKEVLKAARATGASVALATNPLFPVCAVESRLSWIGLSLDDFDYVTTYETSSFCKPNPDYYRSILQRMSASPEETLMIGNDVNEDILPTQELGMSSFLLTDCAIWEKGEDKEYRVPLGVPSGSYQTLLVYLMSLAE